MQMRGVLELVSWWGTPYFAWFGMSYEAITTALNTVFMFGVVTGFSAPIISRKWGKVSGRITTFVFGLEVVTFVYLLGVAASPYVVLLILGSN